MRSPTIAAFLRSRRAQMALGAALMVIDVAFTFGRLDMRVNC